MAASRLQLQTALHKPYDRLLFAKEVLSPVFGSGFSLSSGLVAAPIIPNQSESVVIDKVWIYGNIRLEDGTEITCYEIRLQPNVMVERSRVAIQHYVRKLLVAGQAALVNFIAPSNPNTWRLTLIAKDSELTETGVKEKTTHARRYTFLLGSSETCKTAAERFEILSIERIIDFQTLVKAFSVEKLSKEFFDEYTQHYLKFCNELQESNFRKSVFNISLPTNPSQEEKDKACKPIRDFTKKLLGRIVFLYFVQKKGWLGAHSNEYKDGDPDFMMNLFKYSGGNQTFYPKWLTMLFFETLNQERPEDQFTLPDGKKVKIPYLNGGLFDAEDRDQKMLTFKSSLFHNPNNDDDPKYRGFLDFLNAFNFTIYEDSPDDHTVAVDPEMLGHIFENLLEDNKDKGAFYTPKEIVHYMCQESLIEYLATHLAKDYTVYKPIGDDQFELFGAESTTVQLKLIEKMGDKALNREDVAWLVKQKDISNLTQPQVKRVDELLDSVKICDPAIGSGAFPMGLLQEIFGIKEVIAYTAGATWNPAEVKLNIIQNSIYGVDFEKGAVDIARLRFWLSLVVDEDKPKPLPNLDYKIVTGDSLVGKFDGEIVEINWDRKYGVGNTETLIENIIRLLKELAEKQKEYFSPNHKNKLKLSAKIRKIKLDLLINQLSFNKEDYKNKNSPKGGLLPAAKDLVFNTERELQLKKFDQIIIILNNIKSNPERPFDHFDWKLDFPEVLNPYLIKDEKQRGFDIVIANPPYISIRTKSFDKSLKDFFKSNYELAVGQYDVYNLFLELTYRILNFSGIFSYIIPKRMLSNESFELARTFVINKMPLFKYVDAQMPFENASVETNIMIGVKNGQINKVSSYNYNPKTRQFQYLAEIAFSFIEMMPFTIFPFIFKEDRLKVLEHIQNSRTELLSAYLEITRGFECGYYDESIVNYQTEYPLIKAEAIQKYYLDENDLLFCFPDFNNISKFKTKEVFTKVPKLLTRFTSSDITFSKDLKGYFNTNSVYNCHLKNDSKINYDYLLALLNSKLITFWFNTAFLNTDTLFPHIQKNQLEAIPIIVSSSAHYFVKLSQYIQTLKSLPSFKADKLIPIYFEQILDGLVYELYFPNLIKMYNREILKNLGELPQLNEKMTDIQKIEIITQVFDRLNNKEHPIRVNLFYMNSIPEIAIIEGKNENN